LGLSKGDRALTTVSQVPLYVPPTLGTRAPVSDAGGTFSDGPNGPAIDTLDNDWSE